MIQLTDDPEFRSWMDRELIDQPTADQMRRTLMHGWAEEDDEQPTGWALAWPVVIIGFAAATGIIIKVLLPYLRCLLPWF